MLIARTSVRDIHRNLALEERLLDRGAEFAPALLLWQADNAVVIGKNQNPWRECNLAELIRGGGVLARRISGGGTVYHDPGNLNYALILPRPAYHADRVFDWLTAALAGLGIHAERLPDKTSLAADGRKFSGTAFCYRRAHVLHHGTLLVHSDLGRLRAMLRGGLAVDTRAIPSRPASVVNLDEIQPGLTVDRLAATLADTFPRHFAPPGAAGSQAAASILPDDVECEELRSRNSSWEWNFGHTPEFAVTLNLPEGAAEVTVHGGHIREIRSGPAAAQALVGQPFDGAGLAAAR